jgi:hypothetical protein
MTDGQSDKPPHEELYSVPIEVLGLPENAVRVLKRTGMTSIGDCMDALLRWGDAEIQVPPGWIAAMVDEVEPKMREMGYWPPDE